MTKLMAKNLNDPELLPWIMPDFSTTKETDKVVASIVMMGSMQNYFCYKFSLCCGIPSVTLLGERADWETILQRLEKLPNLGSEPTQFYHLLKPVLTNFVASFDSPAAPSSINVWNKIAHESGGSGPDYLSGWITAFCFWDEKGKSLYTPGGTGPSVPIEIGRFGTSNPGCDLDGTLYHRLDTADIPSGFASVPVKLDDNGRLYDTIMVAGSVGFHVTSSGQLLDEENVYGRARSQRRTKGPTGQMIPQIDVPATPTGAPGLDSVQPVSGWWMYENAEGGEGKTDETGKLHLAEECCSARNVKGKNAAKRPASGVTDATKIRQKAGVVA